MLGDLIFWLSTFFALAIAAGFIGWILAEKQKK